MAQVIASRRTLIALGIWMLGGMLLTATALLLSQASSAAWVVPTALALFGLSVAGPIVVFGWLLGRVFAKHGGWIGVLFAGGIVAGTVGWAGDIAWLLWSGWIAAAIGVAGLVLLAVRRLRALAPTATSTPAPSRRRARTERPTTTAGSARGR